MRKGQPGTYERRQEAAWPSGSNVEVCCAYRPSASLPRFRRALALAPSPRLASAIYHAAKQRRRGDIARRAPRTRRQYFTRSFDSDDISDCLLAGEIAR
jgi:hypothetical protein